MPESESDKLIVDSNATIGRTKMQIGNFEIGYLTEHIESDYAKAIDACQSLEQLKQVLKQFDPFVWIDSPRIKQWNENDFLQFKRFTHKERNIAERSEIRDVRAR